MSTRETHGAASTKVEEAEQLTALERFVAGNAELQKLEQILGRFNVFDALKVARRELQHSNFLAWLIDPHETHGQGDLFLKALLMDILRRVPQDTPGRLSPARLDGADLYDTEIRREHKHIDLLIVVSSLKLAVVIENKVDSGEHSNQLRRYEEVADREFADFVKVFVFLTRDGEETREGGKRWTLYDYENLHHVLSHVREANRASIGSDVSAFLDHYLTLVRSRFMSDPQIDELCRIIYRNHKAAIDLIFERVEVDALEGTAAAREVLESRKDLIVGAPRRSGRSIVFWPRSWIGIFRDADGQMLTAVPASMYLEVEQWEAGAVYLTARLVLGEGRDPESRLTFADALQKEAGLKSQRKELTSRWSRFNTKMMAKWAPDGEVPIAEISRNLTAWIDSHAETFALIATIAKRSLPSPA